MRAVWWWSVLVGHMRPDARAGRGAADAPSPLAARGYNDSTDLSDVGVTSRATERSWNGPIDSSATSTRYSTCTVGLAGQGGASTGSEEYTGYRMAPSKSYSTLPRGSALLSSEKRARSFPRCPSKQGSSCCGWFSQSHSTKAHTDPPTPEQPIKSEHPLPHL